MTAELLDSLEPMIAAIAQEYGRRHHVHGADSDDFRQELRIWVLENVDQINDWLDPDQFSPSHGNSILAKSLRNEAKDYAVDIKAQAVGYKRDDLYFYSKGELKALLPAVFDPEKWHEPPQSEGRSSKSAASGGNWVATLADVSRAVESLEKYDRDVLLAFHRDGWNNKMMAEAEKVSESLMSYRHDRAIKRLLEALGDSAPRPMRQQTDRDPWRGRRAIHNSQARAMAGQVYDGE